MNLNYLFYFCDGISSVFDSQVLELLSAINYTKYFNQVFLFLGIRDQDQKKVMVAKKISPKVKVIFFNSYPNYPFYNYLIRKSLRKALFNTGIKLEETIIHTRGEIIAWHLGEILGPNYYENIVPDVRGVSIEEIKEFSNTNKLLKSLKISNYTKAIKNLNNFNIISVVSHSLKEYLINNYKIDLKKIVITPCLAGTNFRFNEHERELVRKELGLCDEDVLIVFSSGGIANWQNEGIVNILAEKGFKVLNLSQNKFSQKNIISKFVNYSEISMYLNAADIGIVWRNKSIVNKVASPVKFSEFVCCGLPVISNRSVNMISEYITRNAGGLLLESLDGLDLDTLNKFNQKDRKSISESGILNFGIDTIVNQYLKTYELINNL